MTRDIHQDPISWLFEAVGAAHGRDDFAAGKALVRLLLEQMPMVVWILDEDLEFTLSMGAGLERLGLEPNQVVGMSLHEYFGTDDDEFEPIAAHLEALAGKPTVFETRWADQDYSTHLAPLHNQAGETVGVVGIALEITERRRAEDELRRSEQRYRQLFEESQDVIFITTPEGALVDINPAGVKLFGFDSKEEMLAWNVTDLYRSPAERHRYLNAIDGQGAVRDFELYLKGRDGQPLVVLETTDAVFDSDGSVVAYRGQLRDVTDQRELEGQLRQALRMEAVGRMAGGFAHDFNNVLTVVKGRADLLLARVDDGAESVDDLEAIQEAADRAATLTRKLLELRRHRIHSPMAVDLNEFLTASETRLRRVLGPDVELSMSLSPDLEAVDADPGQLQNALLQLVVNASEAMPEGGELLLETVPMSADELRERRRVDLGDGSYARLMIRDSGVGMSPEVMEHIFEPFFSTKKAGESAGLGLATVYAAVQQNGGQIRVESRQGEGSSFYVYLPVA